MLKRYTLIAALLTGVCAAPAQQTGYAGRVAVDRSVSKAGNDVNIRLDIHLDNLDLKSQHTLVLTPVLQSKDKATEKELAPVVVNGRVRQKAYLRGLSLGDAVQEGTEVVRRTNGTAQSVTYTATVPYEKWMRGSTLILREEVSGCAACELGSDERALTTVLPVRTIQEPVYTAAFAVPRTEEVKRRDEQCELHLTYPVGSSAVVPSLGSNREEIARLQEMADRVKANNDLTLTGFRVTGYASPEGRFVSNQSLSGRRAESLAEYFRRTNSWKRDLFTTEAKGEDWDGLTAAITSSNLPEKEKVLAIIREEPDADARDAKIKAIDNGATYNTLLKEYYPPLRRSFCVVDFTVRAYTLEEAKSIIRENPKLLSLKEMYEVANSYPKGSAEAAEAYLTAHRLYPQDADAATNAAAVLMEQGKYAEARKALEGVEETATVCNALGILHAKEKSYEKAAEYFARGAQKGCSEATGNGNALKKFIEELNENNF